MLPAFLVVPGQSAGGPPSTTTGGPVPAARRPVPTPATAPPQGRFYSYGYLVATALVMAVYAVVSYVQPHSVVDIPLGLFALLFAPGYALAAPLLARQPGLTAIVNLPIVVGLSVVFNVLAGIALLRVGPGLSTWDGAIIDLAATVLGLILFVARAAADPEVGPPPSVAQDLAGPLRALRQRLRLVGYSGGQRAAAVVLLVLIVAVLGFIVYVAVAQPHENLTVSFALYGPGGTVASLPSNGTNASVLGVVLTVSNGATAQTFQILVTSELVAHPNAPLTSIPWSQPLPLGRATESVLALPLGAGKNTTVPVAFELTSAGNSTMTFSLYTVTFTLESAAGTPIQSLSLPLNITREG
jgi:uncharacterized membrane protein